MSTHLLADQVVVVMNLLTQHCGKADGLAVYEPGWSDVRIAVEAQAQNPRPDRLISTSQITNRRLAYFGRTKPLPPPRAAEQEPQTQGGALRHRVESIERRLVQIERRLGLRPSPENRTNGSGQLDLDGTRS